MNRTDARLATMIVALRMIRIFRYVQKTLEGSLSDIFLLSDTFWIVSNSVSTVSTFYQSYCVAIVSTKLCELVCNILYLKLSHAE